MPGRILIADEVATNRIIQKAKLAQAHYVVLQAADVQSLVSVALREKPDLIVMSTELPGGGVAKACELLRTHPALQALPVIALTHEAGARARVAALAAGCDDVLVRPVSEQTLLALIRNLIRARVTFEELSLRKDIARDFGLAEASAQFTRPSHIVLIAPSAEKGVRWRHDLAVHMRARIEPRTDLKGIGQNQDHEETPDAFVIAATLKAPGDGLRLVSELRSSARTRGAAILVVTDANNHDQAALAHDMGADGVIETPITAEELALRLTAQIERKRETEQLRRLLDQQLDLALRDPLTGLYNRRYAQTYLSRIAEAARDDGQPFALMVLDLDRFKAVNDRFGHAAGDEVLIEVAERLRRNLREIDLVARLGGEEFLVAMPETDRRRAGIAAERLRDIIGETPFRLKEQGREIAVTMSIGVTVAGGPNGQSDPAAVARMIDQADRALYAAKAEGRNQVTFTRPAA